MDQSARAAVDQRQHGGNGGVRRRAEPQCLRERDAEHRARLGVARQRLGGGAVDQRIEIGEMTQHLGGDRMGQRAIVATVQPARRRVERAFKRQALAQHRVKQAQRRRASGHAGGKRITHLAGAMVGRHVGR